MGAEAAATAGAESSGLTSKEHERKESADGEPCGCKVETGGGQ